MDNRDKMLVNGIVNGIDSAILAMQRAIIMWIAAPIFMALGVFTPGEVPHSVALIGVVAWIFGWMLRPKGYRI